MEILNKAKIKLQKRRFRKAYINYMLYVKSLNCGEQLALFMTSASNLRTKLEREHKKMKDLDNKCPALNLNLIQ